MSGVLPDELPAGSADGLAVEQPTAAQRLAQSRERLRQWMVRGDGRHDARRRVAAAEAEGERPEWLDRLRTLPVIGIVVDAASSWWSSHPLHAAVSIASDAIGPTVRRHPLAAVALAFGTGAALVRWRPWRWVGRPAVFAGIASELFSHLVSQVPFDSWISALSSFAESDMDDHDAGNAASMRQEPADASAWTARQEETSTQ